MNVLVIEDKAFSRELLSYLVLRGGHSVSEAANGADGLALAERETFDVVLSDLSMPGMSGFDVAQALRSRPGPTPMLVAVTLDESAGVRERVLAAGFDHYYAKPVDVLDLVADLEKFMANR